MSTKATFGPEEAQSESDRHLKPSRRWSLSLKFAALMIMGVAILVGVVPFMPIYDPYTQNLGGVTSAKRTALLPEIPAIAEIIPGYEMASWYGMHAPAGTSPAIVTKLHDAVVKLLRTPESLDRLHKGGFDSEGTSPTEFGTKIQNDIVKFSKLVAETGMTTS